MLCSVVGMRPRRELAVFLVVALAVAPPLWLYRNFFNHASSFIHYKRKVCIMSRIRDVSTLLPQWLEFHLAAGIDHFYLTNDCSDNATLFWASSPLYSHSVTLFRNQTFNNCSANTSASEADLIDYTFLKARQSCKWVVLLDVDEYLFPSRFRPDAPLLLTDIIDNLSSPLLRLPWMVMSNLGLERAITGSAIFETFLKGSFSNRLKKTLAKSSVVQSWTSPHHPEKFVSLAPTVGGQQLRDFSRPFRISNAEMETGIDGCETPRATLYIRHYQFPAWEDFLKMRISRRAPWFSGDVSALRRLWLEANMSTACVPPGGQFGSFILERMRQQLRKRLESFERVGSGGVDFDTFYLGWLNGTWPR